MAYTKIIILLVVGFGFFAVVKASPVVNVGEIGIGLYKSDYAGLNNYGSKDRSNDDVNFIRSSQSGSLGYIKDTPLGLAYIRSSLYTSPFAVSGLYNRYGSRGYTY